jgi:hypothetical protein
MIYDQPGLRIYDVKSQTAKYYPYHAELFVLQNYGTEIVSCSLAHPPSRVTQVIQATQMFNRTRDGVADDGVLPKGILIELGAG